MPEAKLNGLNVYYTDEGVKDASAVIFIHGFPFSHAMWKGQVKLLSSTRRVITYDVRGHGKSDLGGGHLLVESLVDDLFGLMDHLGIQAAGIVGLSMGGYIALRGIEREPGRFHSLALCNTKSEADTNEAKIKRAETLKIIKRDGVKAFADGFLKVIFAPESFDKRPGEVRELRNLIESNSPDTICSTLIALAARTDTTGSLGGIRVPVLIITGEKDQLAPPATALEMAERIPGSEVRIIAGAGHMSNLENPDEFNRHLLKFFERQ